MSTKDFLPVLEENLEAMKHAKQMDWKDVLINENPFDCVIETYEDLIAIYKSNKYAGASESGSPKWVKAEDGLPDYIENISGNKASGPVLILIDGEIHTAFLEAVRNDFVKKIWSPTVGNDCFDIEEYYGKKVTHWMPLPKHPSDETPSPSVNDRIEKLEAALRELVRLKDIKNKWESMNVVEKGMNNLMILDYKKRKPLAWEAARELVTPLPEDKK